MHLHSTHTRVRTGLLAVLLASSIACALAFVALPASAHQAPTAGRTAVAHSADKARTVYFHSPSKNIYCAIFTYRGKTTGRCDIKDRDWTAPPAPRSCHLDYGNGAQVVGRHKGGFTCAGDSVFIKHHPVLGYGHSTHFRGVKCTSRRTGMTCKNVKTGHGFTLSRESYSFF